MWHQDSDLITPHSKSSAQQGVGSDGNKFIPRGTLSQSPTGGCWDLLKCYMNSSSDSKWQHIFQVHREWAEHWGLTHTSMMKRLHRIYSMLLWEEWVCQVSAEADLRWLPELTYRLHFIQGNILSLCYIRHANCCRVTLDQSKLPLPQEFLSLLICNHWVTENARR